MNIDFHYNATYLATRLAGYDHKEGCIIAHAAQMVDDCDEKMCKELFVPAWACNTIQSDDQMTAYGCDLLPFTSAQLKDIRLVWEVFHFLPGNLEPPDETYAGPSTGGSWKYDETAKQQFRRITRKASPLAGTLINNMIQFSRKHPATLEMIGLRMHVLADTYAHSYFLGEPCWFINQYDDTVKQTIDGDETEINYFSKLNGEDSFEKSQYNNTLGGDTLRHNSVHFMGHGRYGHVPDYGVQCYTFQPVWKRNAANKTIRKDNQILFYEAFEAMVGAMRCIRENREFSFGEVAKLEAEISQRVKNVLASKTLDQSAHWDNLAKRLFGNYAVPYLSEEWLNNFQKDRKQDRYFYRFITAAREHKDFVVRYLKEKGAAID